MLTVEFMGPSLKEDGNTQSGTARLLNFYRVPSENGPVLRNVPGTAQIAGLGGAFLRALGTVSGEIYAICAGQFYRVAQDGGVTALSAIADGADAVIASADGVPVMTVDGSYRVWSAGALAQPTPGAFSSFSSVCYLAGYTILTEANGRRFQWSAIADPLTLPGLNFSTADATDGNLVRGAAFNGLLWLFKRDAYEGWTPTGGAGADAFERVISRQLGLRAFGAFCEFPGGVFFIGNDGRAHLCTGQDSRPISTPAVERDIAVEADDPVCFFYEKRGQSFFAVRFASKPAWVYDLATGEWHQRAQGVSLSPWAAVASTKAGEAWYVGSALGIVAKLIEAPVDYDGVMMRKAVSRTLAMDGRSLAMLQIRAEQGSGALIWLRLSRDGGFGWGALKARNMGGTGNFARRVTWRNQGQFQTTMTVEISISDPDDVPILASAMIEAA